MGKFSSIGDRQDGSKFPLTGELAYPSRLIPEELSCWSSSGGGVGVRGGAGIGRLDAIAATSVDLLVVRYMVWWLMYLGLSFAATREVFRSESSDDKETIPFHRDREDPDARVSIQGLGVSKQNVS